MPRFVLLLHDCPANLPRPTHCDLMLEDGAVLQTWALTDLPIGWKSLDIAADQLAFSTTNATIAERLADHRLAYLDYQGPVSGDRGSVRRLDAGTYCEQPESLTYILGGKFIRGKVALRQINSEGTAWQLTFTDS